MIIQSRNNKVYKQHKVTNEITTQDTSNTAKKKFQLLEMDDLEEFLAVTSQVLHQFPNELIS